MTLQEQAIDLLYKYVNKELDFFYEDTEGGQCVGSGHITMSSAKKCAIVALENEYKAKRELLYLLRSNLVIESGISYLYYLDLMNKEEEQLKAEIEKL